MRSRRIALLGVCVLGAAACANIWNFEDFQTGAGADASEDVSRPSDAPVGVEAATDAGALTDADAAAVRESSTLDVTDARDERDAGDAHEASVTCRAGFHDCAGTCSSNFSQTSCGTSSCLPCELPLNGIQVMCNGTACVGGCSNTLTLCDGGTATGQCVDLRTDPSHCGACSTLCPAPGAGGVATCGGMTPTCGISCDAGFTACPAVQPSRCVDIASDIRNCGACANACPAREGGPAPSCVDGGCL
jgi:hypothetical protein